MAGASVLTMATLEELPLPWWGTVTTFAARRPSDSAMSLDSPLASISPVNNSELAAPVTFRTQEPSFLLPAK